MRTRKKDRKKVELPGQCCTAAGRLSDVGVRDLTDGGCRFGDLIPPLRVGELINLMIGGTGPYKAHVRWSLNGEVGVSFARPFTEQQLEALISGEQQVAQPLAPARQDEDPEDDRGLPLRSVC